MRARTTAATAITAAALLALTGCKTTTSTNNPTTTPPATGSTPSTTTSTAPTRALPDLTGKGLQSAQDTAQAAGFYSLDSHDALGRARHQILDRDWKVCTQTPKPGQHPASTRVDLGAVKLNETCPDTDQKPPTTTADTMPDFHGKAVSAARAALDPSTSLTTKDASDDNRLVLVESNWQVCTQTPAAGTKLTGQPVTLTAVKIGEHC